MPTTAAASSATFALAGERTIHRMGFGAMRVTGQHIWGPPRDKAEALRVLRTAVERGVDFIDTADSYGPGVSEELLAEALHPYPANLIIATKGGLVRPAPERWDRNGHPDHLRAACEGSLRRLRVERIELYQLHAPDAKVPFEDSVGALADLRREGKIRYVGLSNVSVPLIERAQRLVPIVSVQNRYSLEDRGSEAVLRHCEETGVAFLPWYPLGSGRLVDDPRLGALARKRACTPAQLALAWLLHHSPAMVVIPGTSRVDHLEENLRAADVALDGEAMSAIAAIGADVTGAR